MWPPKLSMGITLDCAQNSGSDAPAHPFKVPNRTSRHEKEASSPLTMTVIDMALAPHWCTLESQDGGTAPPTLQAKVEIGEV